LSQPARRTHLYEFHSQTGQMVVFAGFDMPMWYKGIILEHMAVRNSVGIFDVTHMGRLLISGPEAEPLLNYVTTNDVSALVPLSAQYSTMCNEQGGIKDDFILCRLERELFLVVPNAINRTKDYDWLISQYRVFDVKVEDVSDNIAMFAVQGPKAEQTLQKMSDEDLSKIERFKCCWTKFAEVDVLLSRTGYTGEDGFELFVWDTPLSNPGNAIKVWNAVIEAGQDVGIQPCGLGARDTLRLEAGMCLYGNDIDEKTTPLEAGLSFVVKFKKENFIGKDVLLKHKSEGLKRRRVGVRMLKRGVPRPYYEVWKDEEKVGYLTSGTFSPLLKCGIAMAYVLTEHAIEGEVVSVKIRDKFIDGEIVKFPFYDATQYGFRRAI